MKIDGACHCGAIAFTAEIDPERVQACHCNDCQVLSGSAFRVVARVDEKDFKLVGTPKVYIKTADSGVRRIQAFCPVCGTPIYATAADGEGPRTYGIRLGAIRQRAELAPRRAFWTRSKLPWLDRTVELPCVDEQ